MMFEEIIIRLMNGADTNAIRVMRDGLTKVRAGNKRPHTTSGKTINSLDAKRPTINGGFLNWEFEAADSAIRLNTGGSSKMGTEPDEAPYGRFFNTGGKSQYITALINWCKRKYGLNDIAAKKMAFAVAQAAANRSPSRTVKVTGWFDAIESKVYKQIMDDIQSIIMLSVNKNINKMLKGNK